MVPTRNGKQGKPGKIGGHFPVREKSGILSRLEKSGNFTQIKKNYTGKLNKILEKSETFVSQ